MPTKAIYTKINDKYYKINQDTINPTEVVYPHRTHSQMNTESAAKVVNSNIWINALDVESINSNRELYDKMLTTLTNEKITCIPNIHNHYVMYCDYSVFNYEGKEVNHNAFTRTITPKDAIYVLGVDRVSELVYKQVKTFNTNIALNVKNECPMGIMRNASSVRYTIHINDVSIYQDLKYTEEDVHRSTDPNSYPISEVLENMVRIYSTHENGIAIAAVEVPFIPRKIVLDLSITLDNCIVAYDEQDITDILNKNNGSGPINPGPGHIIIFNGGTATV